MFAHPLHTGQDQITWARTGTRIDKQPAHAGQRHAAGRVGTLRAQQARRHGVAVVSLWDQFNHDAMLLKLRGVRRVCLLEQTPQTRCHVHVMYVIACKPLGAPNHARRSQPAVSRGTGIGRGAVLHGASQGQCRRFASPRAGISSAHSPPRSQSQWPCRCLRRNRAPACSWPRLQPAATPRHHHHPAEWDR